MKTCTKCTAAKPETEFSRYKVGKPGLRAICRQCVNDYSRGRFPQDKEKIKQSNRKNYQKYKERRTGYARRYRENNREKVKAYLRAYHAKNRDSARAYELLRKYNITIDEYAVLSDTQEGLCAICKRPETRKQKGVLLPLVVDHCHETGRVRALLCFRCNTMIGYADDEIERLLAAVDYLKLNEVESMINAY